jgi:hypothetical protein
MFDTLSSEDAKELIDDRVGFKLYTAEQHLRNLEPLDQNGTGINSSWQSRVYWEAEVECFLAQLIGSVDALLIRINDKLSLGLDENSLYSNERIVNTIIDKLNTGKGQVLAELQHAVKSKEWFWTLRDLRNRGMHRKLINIQVSLGGERRVICLMTNPQTDLEVLPYLKDSLQKVKDLIEDIKTKEPSLTS